MKLDFHSHILPSLDDGAKNLADSIMLAKALKSWGGLKESPVLLI